MGILSWLGARTHGRVYTIHVSQYGIVAKLCEKMATSFPTVVKVPFFRALHLHWLRKRALFFYFAFLLLAKLPVYLPDVPILLTKSAWVLIVWEHSVQLCNFCHIFYTWCAVYKKVLNGFKCLLSLFFMSLYYICFVDSLKYKMYRIFFSHSN